MHICFITNEYPKPGYTHGGIGSFISTIAKALVLSGNWVSIVDIGYQNNNEHENDNGIEIYHISAAKQNGLRWYLNSRKINRQIDEINSKSSIDIIETSEMGLAFINKRNNIKYILRLHGGHHFYAQAENRGINLWKGFQEKRSFRKADKIIGVGQFVMDHTSKYIDFVQKMGPVIYNPIDIDKFYEADSSKIITGKIFFAGTICEKKGIRQLIQAMPLIKKEVHQAHLYIAGRDWKFPDGRLYTQYLKKYISNDINDSITFLGPVQYHDIPGLIEKAEVCVFPSHMETFGLTAIEAMSMGKPVVFTRNGPGPEIIEDGVTGLLCDPLDPADIAEKTIRILKNPELKRNLSKAAREVVINKFSLDRIIIKNLNFYRSIL